MANWDWITSPSSRNYCPTCRSLWCRGRWRRTSSSRPCRGRAAPIFAITKPVDVHELAQTVQVALEQCGEAEVIRRFEALERSKRIDVEALLSRSVDRLSRQTEILAMVKKSSGRPNISALARQFRVARRTIIRDLQELIRRDQLPPEAFPKWESMETDADDE